MHNLLCSVVARSLKDLLSLEALCILEDSLNEET
jgi:hypothetical protein